MPSIDKRLRAVERKLDELESASDFEVIMLRIQSGTVRPGDIATLMAINHEKSGHYTTVEVSVLGAFDLHRPAADGRTTTEWASDPRLSRLDVWMLTHLAARCEPGSLDEEPFTRRLIELTDHTAYKERGPTNTGDEVTRWENYNFSLMLLELLKSKEARQNLATPRTPHPVPPRTWGSTS